MCVRNVTRNEFSVSESWTSKVETVAPFFELICEKEIISL